MHWTEAIATGVRLIDAQHLALFNCVGRLEAAAAEGRTVAIRCALDQLKLYARDHFAAEEELMRLVAFPKLAEHRAMHQAFAAQIFELMMTYVHRDVSAEMIAFLRQWLIQHVSGADLEYVAYLPGQAQRRLATSAG